MMDAFFQLVVHADGTRVERWGAVSSERQPTKFDVLDAIRGFDVMAGGEWVEWQQKIQSNGAPLVNYHSAFEHVLDVQASSSEAKTEKPKTKRTSLKLEQLRMEV